MKRLNQTGSHIIALMLLLLVIGVVAFAGYKVSQRNTKPSAVTASQHAVSAPASISNRADLTQASQALDTSSQSVNSTVDSSSLDSSLNDLL